MASDWPRRANLTGFLVGQSEGSANQRDPRGNFFFRLNFETPKSLFGGRDHYEILEIDTEFQTFLDDFTILDLVGHIITTFRRGI